MINDAQRIEDFGEGRMALRSQRESRATVAPSRLPQPLAPQCLTDVLISRQCYRPRLPVSLMLT